MQAEITVHPRTDIHPNGTDRYIRVTKLDETGRQTHEHFLISDIDQPEPLLLRAYDALNLNGEQFILDVPRWFFDKRGAVPDTQYRRQYDELLMLLQERSWGKHG